MLDPASSITSDNDDYRKLERNILNAKNANITNLRKLDFDNTPNYNNQ